MSLSRDDDPPVAVSVSLAIVIACGGAIACLTGCAPALIRRSTAILHVDAGYEPTPGDEMGPAYLQLHDRLTRWGIEIHEQPLRAYGLADLRRGVILIREGLPVNARFEVLAHEAAHLFQPPALEDSSTAQVFAELVAVGIAKHYGYARYLEISARYLAMHKHAFGGAKYLERDIAYAVKALTGQVPMPVRGTP